MNFKTDSKVFEGAWGTINLFGTVLPLEYSGARNECFVARDTA